MMIPRVKAIRIERKIPEMMDTTLSALIYLIIMETGSCFSIENRIPATREAPSNSNTIETVVDVGKPNVLKISSSTMSVSITARNIQSILSRVKY